MRSILYFLFTILVGAWDADSHDERVSLAPAIDQDDLDEPNENSASGSKYFSMPLIQMLSLAACVYPIYIGYQNAADPVPSSSRNSSPNQQQQEAVEDLKATYYSLGEGYDKSESESCSSDDDLLARKVLDSSESSGTEDQEETSKEPERKRKRKKKKKKRFRSLKLNPGFLISNQPYIPKIEQLYYHDGVLVNPQSFEVLPGTVNAKSWMQQADKRASPPVKPINLIASGPKKLCRDEGNRKSRLSADAAPFVFKPVAAMTATTPAIAVA